MAIEAVLIDSREPQWCRDLKFGGVPTTVVMLETGDLQVVTSDAALLVIERKTASDLLNTLRSDRLFPQMARMRELSQWTYLLVCGDLRPGPGGHCLVDGRESGWNWTSVSGALLTCQEMGVQVLQVASDFDYEAAVIQLANRERGTVRVSSPRDASIITDEEKFLAALPGVGPERARALLQSYSPAQALMFLTLPHAADPNNELSAVPGVGEGIKRKVKHALHLTDHEYLDVAIFVEENEKK